MRYGIMRERKMKKSLTFFAMIAILIGTAALLTGCGAKPKAGQVYKVTKGVGEVETYWCFHSDGNLYVAAKVLGVMGASKVGAYKITAKEIEVNSVKYAYTLKKNKLSFKYGAVDYEMEKVDSPTEKEIKDKVANL